MQTFSTFSLPKTLRAFGSQPVIQGESKNDTPFVTPKAKPLAPIASGSSVPGYSSGVTNGNLASTLFGNPGPATGGSSSNGGGGGGQTQNVFDLSTDPYVRQIQQLGQRDYADAVAQGDAQRKQLLIGSGFGDIARAARFGSLENPTTGDAATAQAADTNPYSIAANLRQQHTGNEQGIDLNANKSNLFYGSTRANALGDESRNYLGQVAQAQDQVRASLAEIVNQLAAARAATNDKYAQALATARADAIQNALASGQVFVGYDANGNPIFSKPAVSNGSAASGGGGGAQPAAPSSTGGDLIAAMQTPEAVAARQRGQRGEFQPLY